MQSGVCFAPQCYTFNWRQISTWCSFKQRLLPSQKTPWQGLIEIAWHHFILNWHCLSNTLGSMNNFGSAKSQPCHEVKVNNDWRDAKRGQTCKEHLGEAICLHHQCSAMHCLQTSHVRKYTINSVKNLCDATHLLLYVQSINADLLLCAKWAAKQYWLSLQREWCLLHWTSIFNFLWASKVQ